MLGLLCPKRQYPIQAGKANHRTGMNEPDATIFYPGLCNQEAQNQAALDKVDLYFFEEEEEK